MSDRAPSRGWCYTEDCKKKKSLIYINTLYYCWVRQDIEECRGGRWGVMRGWGKPRWETADRRRKMTVAAERHRIPGWAVMVGAIALNLIIPYLKQKKKTLNPTVELCFVLFFWVIIWSMCLLASSFCIPVHCISHKCVCIMHMWCMHMCVFPL